MIIGGSLGSKVINESVRKILNEILKEYNVIHLCGKGNLDESLKNLDGYRQYEYISGGTSRFNGFSRFSYI